MKRGQFAVVSILIGVLWLMGCGSETTTNETIDGDVDVDHDTVVTDGDDVEDEREFADLENVCVANSRECYGNTVFICNSNGTGYLSPEECTDEQFCTDGACVNQLCDPNSAVCADMTSYKVCQTDGSGYGDALPCGTDKYCKYGSCIDMVCQPNEVGCVGNAYAQCQEDGSGWGTSTDCRGDQFCRDGQCRDQVCTPNEYVCDGTAARRKCAADGSGYDDPELCETNQYCDGGQCQNRLCTPSETKCDGDAVLTCNDLGSAWDGPVACENGDMCVSGACLPTVCSPGSKVCSGNAVLTCNEGGDGYDVPVPCSDVQFCQDGACVAQVCTPQSRECNADGAVIICNNQGSAWGAPSACGDTQYCSGGYCLNQVCTPEQQVCDSTEAYKVCNDDGSGWNAPVDCTDNTLCVQGQCQAPVCTPNESSCQGNAVIVCNADGMGYSSPVNCGDGKYCENGVCYQEACEPGTLACEGNAVKQCNEQGSAWSAPSDCIEGTYCRDGVCQNQLCYPNERTCADGFSYHICTSTGLTYGDAVSCGNGNYCSDPNGECLPQVCEPGASECTGPASYKDCADDGSVWQGPFFCQGENVCEDGVCKDPSQVADPTIVVELVRPQPGETLSLTQGDSVNVLVNAYVNGSGSIADVELLIDGTSQGTDSQAPYEFSFTIPAEATTGHVYELQAEANSTLSRYNVSQAAYIEVRNDPPNAAFTATATGATTVVVDASASSDTESATDNLQVRWDWENDGTWDTAFTTEKVAEHDYGEEGTFTIACEVKDEVDQNDIATHNVTLTSIRYISGTIDASDTWTGTVIITGDVTITNGATITVLAGTNVLFTYSDVEPVGNPDGIGDYGIDVINNANFNILGTEADPVVFSVNGADHRTSMAWDHIRLAGSPSSFQHVVVEYGTTCLMVQDASTFEYIESRFCKDALVATNADNMTVDFGYFHNNDNRGLAIASDTDTYVLQDIESADNGTDGINIIGGSAGSIVRCSVHDNGQDGISVDSSPIDISECVKVAAAEKFGNSQSGIANNARYGLNFTGSPSGLITHNDIVYNGAQGVNLIVRDSSPVINWNNIYSNSTQGGTRLVAANTSSTLATSGRASYTTITSGYWTAPDNGEIIRVKINYSESYSDGYVSGGIYKTGGTSVWSTSSNRSNYWVDIPSSDIHSIAVYIYNSGYTNSSYSHSITGSEVVYQVSNSAGIELSASAVNNVVDAQFNYWGIFPNALSAISMDRTDAVNMEGFVGRAFDGNWSRGPYISGAFTADTTLSGTIYITGDVTVASGATLTLQPNTDVQFVKHDQNDDGVGDFTITVDGSISAVGNAANRISFDGVGEYPDTDSFEGIILNGQGSTLQYVDISNGKNNVRLNNCAATLSNLVVADATNTGVYLNALTNDQTPPDYDAVFSNSTITGCDKYGLQVYGGQVSLSYLTVINNEGTGIAVNGGSSNLSLKDSTIRNNGSNGITVAGPATVAMSYNVFNNNTGTGVEIAGNVTGVFSYSEVSLNQREGFYVYSKDGVTPGIAIQNNNIFANSVTSGMSVDGSSVSISTSGRASYTTITSSYWTVPDSARAMAAKITYSESYSDGYVSGGIYKTGGVSIWSTSSNVSNRWVDLTENDVSSLAVYIYNSGYTNSSYSHSITCSEVVYGKVDGTGLDMTAFSTNTNRINAQNNWWNGRLGGQIVDVLSDYPVGTVDYAGAVGNQWTVGPR